MALFGRSKTQVNDNRRVVRGYRLMVTSIAILFIATIFYLGRISYLSGRNVDSMLRDVCTQYAHTLDERVNAQLSELRAIANTLEASGLNTYEECIELLSRQDTVYKRMGIVATDGMLYSTGVEPRSLAEADSQKIQLIRQRTGSYGLVTATFEDNDGQSVVLCAANLSGNGPISGMLYAILSEELFSELTMGGATSDDYVCVTDQTGKFLNMTPALSDVVHQDDELLSGLRSALLESAHGNFNVVGWGDYRLATAQLSYNGWLMAQLTPTSEVWDIDARDATAGAVISLTLLAIAITISAFALWRKVRGQENRVREAGRDPITGIYNHLGFADAAATLLGRAGTQRFALVCLRTDVQDVYGSLYGYSTGRRVLEDMARIINAECESGEACARMEGGQFLMLLRFSDTADVLLRVKALNSHLLTRLSLRTHLHYGIYVTGDGLLPLNQMIERAAEAARRVMRKGDLVGLYDDELHRRQQQDEALLARAADALKSGEFEVRYLPLRDANTLEIVAAEAVALWHLPDGTVLPPAEFMPLLARNSMAGPLNQFILERACHDLRAELDAGRTPSRVLVHMARECLIDGAFLRSAQQLTQQYALSYSKLEVVLGESVFADAAALNANAIQQLHAAGMRVCVDDYGQGSGSLCAFGDMPVDAIRLADAFCERTTETDKGLELLRGLVALANSLHMDVYAGAVTSAQLELLRASGCMCVQRVLDAPDSSAEYCSLSDVRPEPQPESDGFDDWA